MQLDGAIDILHGFGQFAQFDPDRRTPLQRVMGPRIESERLGEVLFGPVELLVIIGNPAPVLAVIAEQTGKLKEQYGDARRTAITDETPTDFTKEELIPHQEVVVTLSQRGYVKCIPTTTYRLQHRGGKGVRGQTTREGDGLRDHLVADNHDLLLFFTNRGRVYATKVYELPPDTSRTTRGMPLVNVLQLKPDESVKTMVSVSSLHEDKDLLFATRMGEIKRTPLSALANIRTNGLNSMKLERGDELVSVRLATEEDEVIMVSQQGSSIRFPTAQVRRRSRAAGGVRGMRLRDDDRLVAMDVLILDGQLLVISQRGYGKPTALDRYRLQTRGGIGLITFRITSKSGPVATAKVVEEGEEILIISQHGQVTRTSLNELRILSRRTQGVSIMTLADNDEVVSIASMEQRIRTDRDTKPRLARGNSASVEMALDEISTNGHQTDAEQS